MVEVAFEAEIGTLEEVETLVHSLEALLWGICFLWVEMVKVVMQPRLHLEETLAEVEHPDFGPGKMGSFGDQTQPAEPLVH